MTYIMVDVEADGPIAGNYSMIFIGRNSGGEALDKAFYGRYCQYADSLATSRFSALVAVKAFARSCCWRAFSSNPKNHASMIQA